MVTTTRAAIAIGLALACSSEPAIRRPASAGSDSLAQHPAIDYEKLATSPKLSLIIDTRLVLPIAYGNRWHAKVTSVIAGELADRELSLTTFSSSTEDGHFAGDEAGLLVTFVKLDHRPVAFPGFVAADGTVWMIWSTGK